MTTDDYRRALATAIREYEALGQQRQDIDKRLRRSDADDWDAVAAVRPDPDGAVGLTDACRLVVRGAGVPVTPADVRQRLHSIGFDLSKYANDLAAIHTILKRLNESGELRVWLARGADPGKHAYLWNHGPHAIALGADIAAFMRDANLEREAMHAHEAAAAPRPKKPAASKTRSGAGHDRARTAPPVFRRGARGGLPPAIRRRSSTPSHASSATNFCRRGRGRCCRTAATSYMMGGGVRTRVTPDADPARVHHNIAVAIDAGRQLFNGQPATLGAWIDALEPAPAARVLHVGCGLGYYTAVIGECVGPPDAFSPSKSTARWRPRRRGGWHRARGSRCATATPRVRSTGFRCDPGQRRRHPSAGQLARCAGTGWTDDAAADRRDARHGLDARKGWSFS